MIHNLTMTHQSLRIRVHESVIAENTFALILLYTLIYSDKFLTELEYELSVIFFVLNKKKIEIKENQIHKNVKCQKLKI